MYLVSKRALAYDIMFNHTIFNPLLAVGTIVMAYGIRVLDDKYSNNENKGKKLFAHGGINYGYQMRFHCIPEKKYIEILIICFNTV